MVKKTAGATDLNELAPLGEHVKVRIFAKTCEED